MKDRIQTILLFIIGVAGIGLIVYCSFIEPIITGIQRFGVLRTALIIIIPILIFVYLFRDYRP